MGEFILAERKDGVAVLTLNRPRVLNAWHRPMRAELVAAIKAADGDAAVRAIILTGAGDRAFCAGQDLNETQAFGADEAEAWMHEWEHLYDLLRSLPKPLIAALNGIAAGSAFQVALLADFRVGHPGVRMGQPEINSGIASVMGPWIMNAMLGLARTTDLALTGRMMEAEECRAIGLINRLVPAERVMAESLSLAAEVAAKPAVALRLTKQRLREMTEPSFREAVAAGIRIQRQSYATGEPAEVMGKFLSKRRRPGDTAS